MESNSQVARLVKTSSATYAWTEKHCLTDSQKRTIHPDLKWVISFPLTFNDGTRFRAMGVLNVDGLIYELEEDHLAILLGELTSKVAAISGLLAQNPKREFDAVLAAVYVHGLAGDIARETMGEHSLVATDLVKTLPEAFRRVRAAAAEKWAKIES